MTLPVEPTKSKLVIKRGKKTSTKLVPMPNVIVDTREQKPYTFSEFGNWIGSVQSSALKTGDYSIAGYEDCISIERKSLPDLVGSLMAGRERFLREIRRLSLFKYKMLLIEASRKEVKSPYTFAREVKCHPNGIIGSLDAISARYGIPIHYGSDRGLSEEFAASWLSKVHAYEWLERNGHGRVLQEGDL